MRRHTAGYDTHVWNYIMSSCWKIKYTTHISLKKHLASYQKVFHANESAELYIYTVGKTYMEEKVLIVSI